MDGPTTPVISGIVVSSQSGRPGPVTNRWIDHIGTGALRVS